MIKKCANPDCNNDFEYSDTRPRKKYCSYQCAKDFFNKKKGLENERQKRNKQ